MRPLQFFSYNGVFVAFLMKWGPNGDQIRALKLQNGDLWLKKLQKLVFLHFYQFLHSFFCYLPKTTVAAKTVRIHVDVQPSYQLFFLFYKGPE